MIRVPDTKDTDFNRAYAGRVVTRIDQHQNFVFDQVASMAKWLMASLLAVNGAGAIAAVNASGDGDPHRFASLLFVLGTGFALLSGVAMQEIYNRTSEPLMDFDRYWTCVAITGARDEACEGRLTAAAARVHRFAFVPPLVGWVSGLLFLAGALALAFG